MMAPKLWIRATIRATMTRSDTYDVFICFGNNGREITAAYCECKGGGDGKIPVVTCKHVVAVLYDLVYFSQHKVFFIPPPSTDGGNKWKSGSSSSTKLVQLTLWASTLKVHSIYRLYTNLHIAHMTCKPQINIHSHTHRKSHRFVGFTDRRRLLESKLVISSWDSKKILKF